MVTPDYQWGCSLGRIFYYLGANLGDFGEALGGFGDALGGFGRLWGGLGRLWKLLGDFCTTFRHFVAKVAFSFETSSFFKLKC